ncbi:MAG: primosomal protein N' [Treponema sp.]|nr:MAG: primosomal protein N' [Treponema sp.]
MKNAKWVEVVFNVPVFAEFTYRLELENGKDITAPSLVGRRVVANLGNREAIGFVIREFDELPSEFPVSPDKIKPLKRIVDVEPIFGQLQIELSFMLSRFYICSVGECLSAMLPSGRRMTAFESLTASLPHFNNKDIILSDEQEYAVKTITVNLDKADSFYLYGVTGSGKTEVFLQIADEVLKQNKAVIYLVPEIALTHQVTESVVSRFGDLAAVLHSGLSTGKKFSEWMRIKNGDARIIIGPRSAVFAPAKNLGLIIIDEEHDGSYKSGSSPRYHARQVAMMLSKKLAFPVVMGSATPSVEAWHLMQIGKIKKLKLTKRLAGGNMPKITTVNMCGEKNSLSRFLVDSMRKIKSEGKQSIVFLNRRGFSHFFKCHSCGFEMLCKNCSVPLTWHKSSGVMKCHYCGWQCSPPETCPECGSLETGYAGFGTEFIENEIIKGFPDCVTERIDTDALSGKAEKLKQAIEDFKTQKTDILLGTQMVAKGLNFPNVKLVGIALADTGLQMPDFRAAERTFSLITQVAGRAGRYIPDGEVIIQTLRPEHPAIVFAKDGRIEDFYEYELAQRQALFFPPFSRLLRLVFRSKQLKKAELAAYGAKEILENLIPETVEIMGPSECMLAMISGNYRMQILLRSEKMQDMQKPVMYFVKNYSVMTGVYIEIDIDPVSLM